MKEDRRGNQRIIVDPNYISEEWLSKTGREIYSEYGDRALLFVKIEGYKWEVIEIDEYNMNKLLNKQEMNLILESDDPWMPKAHFKFGITNEEIKAIKKKIDHASKVAIEDMIAKVKKEIDKEKKLSKLLTYPSNMDRPRTKGNVYHINPVILNFCINKYHY